MKSTNNSSFFLAILVAAAFLFPSCKKCVICILKDSKNKSILITPEKCGNSADLASFENELRLTNGCQICYEKEKATMTNVDTIPERCGSMWELDSVKLLLYLGAAPGDTIICTRSAPRMTCEK